VKAVDNLIGKVRPAFQKGGKLEKYWPVLDALETFAFVPDHTTKSGAHIRDAIDMKRTMFLVIVAMVPALLFGMYNLGYQHFNAMGVEAAWWEMALFGLTKTLPIIIVSYGVGLGVEFVFCIIKGHAIYEGFLVSGMLIVDGGSGYCFLGGVRKGSVWWYRHEYPQRSPYCKGVHFLRLPYGDVGQ